MCLGGKETAKSLRRAVAGYILSFLFPAFSRSSFIHVPHIFACDMGIKLLRFWALCEPNALKLPGFSVRNQKVIYDKSVKL